MSEVPADGDRVSYVNGGFYREGVGITVAEAQEAAIHEVPGAQEALEAARRHQRLFPQAARADSRVDQPDQEEAASELGRVSEIAHGAVDRLCSYDAWAAPGDFHGTAERIANFLHDFVLTAAPRLEGVATQGVREADKPVLTPAEATAIADCISVASRIGGPYEVYGGVEVKTATTVAQRALDRLGFHGLSDHVDDEAEDDDEGPSIRNQVISYLKGGSARIRSEGLAKIGGDDEEATELVIRARQLELAAQVLEEDEGEK